MNYNAGSTSLLLNKKAVPKEFNKIARRYDLATGLSQGYQEDLERSASYLQLKGNETVLDLCCGTGRSSQAVLNRLPAGKVIGVDNSEEMLEVASKKFYKEIREGRMQLHLMDAMELEFPPETFTHIFMAYGLRNMPDYGLCLEQLQKLLKPGGTLVIHDYSLAEGWYVKPMWWTLGNFCILPVSYITTGSARIFSYLVKSVTHFLRPAELENLLRQKGFTLVSSHPQKSWRKPILRTFVAKRP